MKSVPSPSRLIGILWFLCMIALGAWLGGSAPGLEAQPSTCENFNDAYGTWRSSVCWPNHWQCGQDVCEVDTCKNACFDGEIRFCVAQEYCATPEIRGCWNCSCGPCIDGPLG